MQILLFPLSSLVHTGGLLQLLLLQMEKENKMERKELDLQMKKLVEAINLIVALRSSSRGSREVGR